MDDRTDPIWCTSTPVRAALESGDLGAIVRSVREANHLTLAELGTRCGYSASTVSRLETGRQPLRDVRVLRSLADALGIPAHMVGLAEDAQTAPTQPLAARVTPDSPDEENVSMHRRTLLGGLAGLAGSAVMAGTAASRLDDALVALPATTRRATTSTVAALLAASHARFDAGNYTALVDDLPDLLASAHDLADTTDAPGALSLVAASYVLATHTLLKIGRHHAGRLTADRAMTYARRAGSPLAVARSSRALGVVLRHEGRPLMAQRVNLDAIAAVEATGLATREQRTVLTQMLCSASYAAAQGNDRDRALELVADAKRAVHGLPDPSPNLADAAPIGPAHVQLYEVGVFWALGESGRALDSARGLRPAQFTTAERRGRLHTDLARAWWQHGRPEQTVASLLAAHREAPTELTARPAIRGIARDLIHRHPQLTGTRHLRTALLARPDPGRGGLDRAGGQPA